MPGNTQLNHQDHKPSAITFPLNLIANDISSPQNVGSLFRLCDALGVEKLFLCGNTLVPPNKKINKTSRSTEKYVAFEEHENAVKLVKTLKQSEVTIISLEISSSSLAIACDEVSQAIQCSKSVYLILGSENAGVSEDLLALSDITVHIPMFGKNSSMNVVTAASIACYEITKTMLAKRNFIAQ